MPVREQQNEYNLEYEDTDIPEAAEALGYLLPEVPDEIGSIGEADGANWREFPDLATNSLWIISSRAQAGMHNGKYHGNFVPQIPYQAIRRFTKPGDVVLDPFLGSGTTLIECRRQGRHGLGVELVTSIADDSKKRIEAEANPHNTWQEVIAGDSTAEQTMAQVREVLQLRGRAEVQLVVMHPPYHDIVHFSDNPQDLCNAPSVTDFLASFTKVVRGTYSLLQRDHFLVVVIGDKYSNGEWVPLGFHTMEAVRSAGYTLKSIVVKNMEGNRAKRNLENLWRQRAFRGKYYIFKHEYVLFFQKTRFAELLRRVVEHVKALDDREELDLIDDRMFVTGEDLVKGADASSWVSPSRILGLRHGRLRAVVVDLTGTDVTSQVQAQLESFIRGLPADIVDVSVIAESGDNAKQIRLAQIPGVSQVYDTGDQSLEQLARALYVIRKATGSGQRTGRATGVAFSDTLGEALGQFFRFDWDFDRPQGRRGSFRFFRRDPTRPLAEDNCWVRIETKWVSGHESEKLPQIRDRYENASFKVVAVVGHSVDRWKKAIERMGNFADYYLFVSKDSAQMLEQTIQTQPLYRVVEPNVLEETSSSLVALLHGIRQQSETAS